MTGPTPLLVFLKPPVPGQVKTRLAAAIGDAPAARLYGAFVRDLLARVATAPRFLPVLCVAGETSHPALDEMLQGLPGWPRRPQRGTGLGERMGEALAWALARCERALLIGSDLPTLRLARLDEAVEKLCEGPGAVFGPSDDGGYYLVGATSRARPPLADPSIRYSTSDTLGDTELACQRAGVATHRLSSTSDVDDLHDLKRLSHTLELDSTKAPHTARLLRELG